MEIEKSDIKALSASRIKTFESCSWLYWCQYHLKLPRSENDGSRKGSICHSIFELLLNPKHKSKYDQIIRHGTVTIIASMKRLIEIYIRRLNFDFVDERLFVQIDEMIMVGLKADFFVAGADLVSPEYQFNIQNKDPKYHIKGFIDKPFLKQSEIVIDDFKSSKKKFSGEDEESNVQAMIYSLAALKIWPDKTPEVRFIFLQFPDDPMMKVKFSKDTLNGFEYYLAEMQNKVDTFSEKEAKKNFAFDKDPPKTGEFKGRLLCGFSKYEGHKKKDGTKMFGCPYKFAFKYYTLKKNKTVIKSSFKKEELKPKAGEVVEEASYDGCPRFINTLNDFGEFPIKEIRKYENVLDDLL